jgi:hypothetical protein
MDILPDAQRAIWPDLSKVADLGFTLYGGTAIALRLGHRKSVDFDFFSEKPFLPGELVENLPVLQGARPLQSGRNTFTALVSDPEKGDSVKLSFFGGLAIGRVGTPDWTEDCVLRVASPIDLLATKLKALLERLESKDYIDIAALTKGMVSLNEGLAAAQLFYPETFPPAQCLKTLTWFEEGDLALLSEADRHHLIQIVAEVGDVPELSLLSESLGSDIPCPEEGPRP